METIQERGALWASAIRPGWESTAALERALRERERRVRLWQGICLAMGVAVLLLLPLVPGTAQDGGGWKPRVEALEAEIESLRATVGGQANQIAALESRIDYHSSYMTASFGDLAPNVRTFSVDNGAPGSPAWVVVPAATMDGQRLTIIAADRDGIQVYDPGGPYRLGYFFSFAEVVTFYWDSAVGHWLVEGTPGAR